MEESLQDAKKLTEAVLDFFDSGESRELPRTRSDFISDTDHLLYGVLNALHAIVIMMERKDK
jgi:hypothetical protein